MFWIKFCAMKKHLSVTGVLEISGPCTTELASYLLIKWRFWQLALKWLSGARAQDKTKQYYCHFFFQDFILRDSCDIGFRVQFNTEFPRRVMNFSIEFHSIGHIDLLITAAQIQEFCHLSFDITRPCPRRVNSCPGGVCCCVKLDSSYQVAKIAEIFYLNQQGALEKQLDPGR